MNCLLSRGPPLLLTPNPEDPWVAALGLNWGVTSPEKDVVLWGFGEQMLRGNGKSGAELLGINERERILFKMCRQWASTPLCSALNAGGTPASRVCCKSPGLEAAISPTTALGVKVKFGARTVPTSFQSWTLLRMGSHSLAPSPSATGLLGRMRDKGQDVAASQPWWDTAKMPPNIALNLCGCRVGFKEKC